MDLVSIYKSLFCGYGDEIEKKEGSSFASKGVSIGESIRFNVTVVKVTGAAAIIFSVMPLFLRDDIQTDSLMQFSVGAASFAAVCCTSALTTLNRTLEVWHHHEASRSFT